MRIACVVEYDGSGFRGWQSQRTGRTVQGALELALSAVADEPVTVICAGRTDAGVHATGQVVHFDTAADRPDRAWLMGTNSNLPGDIAVRFVSPVEPHFHARHTALGRHYRYLISAGPDRPALWRDRVGWNHAALDAAAMQRGARFLLGERDFSAFRSADCQSNTPMRRIDDITVTALPGWVRVDVTGNAFLHNMVRIIVGTLLAVGRGERAPDWVGDVLAGGDRRKAGVTAKAEGLYFLGPRYPEGVDLPVPRLTGAFPPVG
jgi:tRNA pseudouridine38-40 synthase